MGPKSDNNLRPSGAGRAQPCVSRNYQGSEGLEMKSADVAFPQSGPGRHPDLRFRSSIPCPPLPLSTLRRPPHDDRRKTQGRDGVAPPFLYGSCIPYNMPVYPGAPWHLISPNCVHPNVLRGIRQTKAGALVVSHKFVHEFCTEKRFFEFGN